MFARRPVALVAIAALVVPIVAAAVVAVVSLSDGAKTSEPAAISSAGSSFSALDELVTASDLVVVATVADVEVGRVLTAPGRPEAGVRTRLLALDVTRTLAGTTVEPLIVEEPAELLDGTPVVVDGIMSLDEGDQAIWFLVAGGSEEQPYHAVLSAQGRYQIVGTTLQPAGSDPLSRRLAALAPDALIAAVQALP